MSSRLRIQEHDKPATEAMLVIRVVDPLRGALLSTAFLAYYRFFALNTLPTMEQVDLRLYDDFELCLEYLDTNLAEIQVPTRSPARAKQPAKLITVTENWPSPDVDDISSTEYILYGGGSSPTESIFSQFLSPNLGPSLPKKEAFDEAMLEAFLEDFDLDDYAEICTITDVVEFTNVHRGSNPALVVV